MNFLVDAKQLYRGPLSHLLLCVQNPHHRGPTAPLSVNSEYAP